MACGRRAKSRDIVKIERTERRKNSNAIAVANTVGKCDRAIVHDDEIDLRVGHAKRFDADP